MGMSNKEISALIREAESREALAGAIKSGGRKFSQAREELERAVGGKKMLDRANKILADAEEQKEKAGKIESEARRAAGNIIEDAKAELNKMREAFQADASRVQSRGDALDAREEVLKSGEETLADSQAKVKSMGERQDVQADGLAQRETELTERKAELDESFRKFKRWRDSAPPE